MEHVEIYTDGACSGNPGPGGWGAVLSCKKAHKELSGASNGETTNNRMELLAAIEGLKALKKPCKVQLFSDSQYVVYTMTKGWKRRVNKDLWKDLDNAAEKHEVLWTWIKGHNHNPFNEKDCGWLSTLSKTIIPVLMGG